MTSTSDNDKIFENSTSVLHDLVNKYNVPEQVVNKISSTIDNLTETLHNFQADVDSEVSENHDMMVEENTDEISGKLVTTQSNSSRSDRSSSSGSSRGSSSGSSVSIFDFTCDLLKDRYYIIYLLGSGTFSAVWLAYDLKNKDYVAIKIQNPEDYKDAEYELQIYQKLGESNNQHIAKLLDFFKYEQDTEDSSYHVCLVFNLYGFDIYNLLKRYNTGLDVKTVKKIMNQSLDALVTIHDKYRLIHTDIKPENIMIKQLTPMTLWVIEQFNSFEPKKFKSVSKFKKFIDPKVKELEDSYAKMEYYFVSQPFELDTENIEIVLTDFGSACYETESISDDIQTRYYRAPEVILGKKFYKSVDMWSMGCICYELLTANTLFDADKTKNVDRDTHHLYIIQKFCGIYPKILLGNAKYAHRFFNANGVMKEFDEIPQYNISGMLSEEFMISNEESDYWSQLLEKCFIYHPRKRISASEALTFLNNE